MLRMIAIAIMILISLHGTSFAQDKDETIAQAQYWLNLGLCNMENPKPFFKKAIEVCSGCALPYYWLGMYYCNSGKETEAIDMFKKYLKLVDKNDPQETARIKAAKDYIKGVRLKE